MFTIREVTELAVQIESNGENVYRQVAALASDPELKALLEELAREEGQHARWFRRLGESDCGDFCHRGDEDELETMGRALLTEMLGQQTFSLDAEELQSAETMAAVIAQATEFERDTIVFYEMLSDFIGEAEVKDRLSEIIAEEKSHIHRLNGFLERPSPSSVGVQQ